MNKERASAAWQLAALEIATAIGAAVAFVAACANIRVNALVRIGQVSGLAAVELRLLWFGLPLLAALLIAAKLRDGRALPVTGRLVCAALAGLSSAAVAGGILVTLVRTRYGLGAYLGDSGVLVDWADAARKGITPSGVYPPGQVELLVWISDLLDLPPVYANKWFQIGGVALLGPLAYASWRLLLPPASALAIGVVASLGLYEAYRPYPMLVLIVILPLLIKFLDVLRRSPELSLQHIVRVAVLMGIALAIAFLLYSGWFQWSAPGFLLAAAIVFPWRRSRNGAVLCGVAALVFTVVAFEYLRAIAEAPPIGDDYFPFDAYVEPAYIAMWRGGLPGTTGPWPPIGELGGVGLFTVLLAVGLGCAIAFGRGRTLVIGIACILAGVWLFRFWHAHNMYELKLVQLYTRTSAELYYGGVVLALFAARAVFQRVPKATVTSSSALVGICAAFLMLCMSTSSATADKYMPTETADHMGRLSWVALKTPMLHQSQALDATIEVSSSHDDLGYSVRALVDGKPQTAFSSEPGITHDHEEWVVLQLSHHVQDVRRFSRLVLYPASDGFPIDLTVDLWDGQTWVPRITKTALAQPTGPVTFDFPREEATTQLRLRATKLRRVGSEYVLRLAEIQLFR